MILVWGCYCLLEGICKCGRVSWVDSGLRDPASIYLARSKDVKHPVRIWAIRPTVQKIVLPLRDIRG